MCVDALIKLYAKPLYVKDALKLKLRKRADKRERETQNNFSKSSEGVSVRQHRGGIQLLAGKKQNKDSSSSVSSFLRWERPTKRVWKK